MRITFQLIVSFILAVVLTSCGTFNSPSTSAGQATASAAFCDQCLERANNRLAQAKKHTHSGLNWSPADKALVAARHARHDRNYGLCVIKSREVSRFIERDKNYLRWQKSVSL